MFFCVLIHIIYFNNQVFCLFISVLFYSVHFYSYDCCLNLNKRNLNLSKAWSVTLYFDESNSSILLQLRKVNQWGFAAFNKPTESSRASVSLLTNGVSGGRNRETGDGNPCTYLKIKKKNLLLAYFISFIKQWHIHGWVDGAWRSNIRLLQQERRNRKQS